jgi:hypothetical protein
VTRRVALLIGNAVFDSKESFSHLRTPENDARDLARVLGRYCGFETDMLVNATSETIRRAVDGLFGKAERGDLVLMYYSGHGIRDRAGRHYLIARDTHPKLLLSSGVWETFIHAAMSQSRSRHRVIILDCCFSGAFIQGRTKGDDVSIPIRELKGEAEAILTSSSTIQYSFEEDHRNSLFTKYLLQGIETGEADEDQDGNIRIEELFRYAERHVRDVRPEQTPMMELSVREGWICIAERPNPIHRKLANIRGALQSEFLGIRLGAIDTLENLARDRGNELANYAVAILVSLQKSDDLQVRRKVEQVWTRLPRIPEEPQGIYAIGDISWLSTAETSPEIDALVQEEPPLPPPMQIAISANRVRPL